MGGAWTFSGCKPVPTSQCVFGQNGHGAYGIPLIVEELQRYGMTATFFCEMLASYVLGEPEISKVTDFLLSHGQDVQLHLHPTFWHYHRFLTENPGGSTRSAMRCDLLSSHDESQQMLIIEKGVDLFRRLVGEHPLAFRAGGYAANRTTLQVLRRMGINLDCSFNPVYPGNSFAGAFSRSMGSGSCL